jgi:hypothetical protein
MDDATKRPLSRRDALKALAGITGAVALSGLPNKWATPLVEVGALPAFAQCSPTANTSALRIVNQSAVTTYRVTVVDALEAQRQVVVDAQDEGCIEGIAPGVGTISVMPVVDNPDGGVEPASTGEEYTFVAGVLHTINIGGDV